MRGRRANTGVFIDSPQKQRDAFSANRISCFSRFGQAVPVSRPLDPPILRSETFARPDAKADTNAQSCKPRNTGMINVMQRRGENGARSHSPPKGLPEILTEMKHVIAVPGKELKIQLTLPSGAFSPCGHFHMLAERECFGVTPGNLQFNGLQNKSMLTLRFSCQIRSFKVKRLPIALTAPFRAFALDRISFHSHETQSGDKVQQEPTRFLPL